MVSGVLGMVPCVFQDALFRCLTKGTDCPVGLGTTVLFKKKKSLEIYSQDFLQPNSEIRGKPESCI